MDWKLLTFLLLAMAFQTETRCIAPAVCDGKRTWIEIPDGTIESYVRILRQKFAKDLSYVENGIQNATIGVSETRDKLKKLQATTVVPKETTEDATLPITTWKESAAISTKTLPPTTPIIATLIYTKDTSTLSEEATVPLSTPFKAGIETTKVVTTTSAPRALILIIDDVTQAATTSVPITTSTSPKAADFTPPTDCESFQYKGVWYCTHVIPTQDTRITLSGAEKFCKDRGMVLGWPVDKTHYNMLMNEIRPNIGSGRGAVKIWIGVYMDSALGSAVLHDRSSAPYLKWRTGPNFTNNGVVQYVYKDASNDKQGMESQNPNQTRDGLICQQDTL